MAGTVIKLVPLLCVVHCSCPWSRDVAVEEPDVVAEDVSVKVIELDIVLVAVPEADDVEGSGGVASAASLCGVAQHSARMEARKR